MTAQNNPLHTLSGSPARRTDVVLSIAGTDVTPHLTPDLISFEHSDDVEKNADTITLRLSDVQHKYLFGLDNR